MTMKSINDKAIYPTKYAHWFCLFCCANIRRPFHCGFTRCISHICHGCFIILKDISCQPDESLASLLTSNRIINIYGFLIVIMLFMYCVLHRLYYVGNKITTTTTYDLYLTKTNHIQARTVCIFRRMLCLELMGCCFFIMNLLFLNII